MMVQLPDPILALWVPRGDTREAKTPPGLGGFVEIPTTTTA